MKNTFNRSRVKVAAIALALPLAVVNLPQEVQAHPADAMSSISQSPLLIQGARLINPTTVEIYYADGQCLTVDFYNEHIFRLFLDQKGGIVRNPEAQPQADILVKNPRRDFYRHHPLTLNVGALGIDIQTPRMQFIMDRKSGLITVLNAKGDKVIEMTDPVTFTEQNTQIRLKERADEYFYGGGVQNGRFSHKGKEIAIVNTNNWVDGGVASPTPFYWSTKGYGFMWHTFKQGHYNFGAAEKGKVLLSHDAKYLDVFFMVDDTPAALLADFYQLTGNPVLLPKFGFYEGHLNAYNRDYWKESDKGNMTFEDDKVYKESQKDNGGIKESLNGELPGNYQFSARAAIDRYVNNDMPLGWFLPNDGYGAGYGQTKTLDGNIQNLKEFGDYARSKGVEIGLWTQSELHPKEGIEALLQRDIVKEVRDAGVRVLKTDVAWVGAGYSFGLNGVSDVGAIMPYYGSDTRPFIISLDGWAGTQRYAGIWSGDQTGGDWEYIRFHIPTFIGSGLSGQPNITNDLDGIFGGKNVPVNVRDFQWKTFTPMELNMDGWGANPKYPHVLGEPAASINRTYLKLKSEMMPYTYSIAREAVYGKPMVRAMFLEDYNEYTLGTATRYQFMYGPSILVAPVFEETAIDQQGNDVRNGIYLPAGQWVDYFSGDVYEGGRIINNFDAPLWKLPVFVKRGAILPMTHPNNNPNEIDPHFRAYEIYADGYTSFTEYDDDGKTQAYLLGMGTETVIESDEADGKLKISIQPTTGSFKGFCKDKRTELRINATQAPKKVMAQYGKKKVTLKAVSSLEELAQTENAFFYDAKPNLNRFATKGSDFEKVEIIKNPMIYVHLAQCDVTQTALEVTVNGFAFAPTDRLLVSTGALETPKAVITEANRLPASLIPSWEKVDGADYYEIEFNGMMYSTIRQLSHEIKELTPEHTYSFKVRAVNKDGYSDWTTVTGTTQKDPLEFTVKGIQAALTCRNQNGQGVAKLFDYDPKTAWHTRYQTKAVPFEMMIDLRTVNDLDRLEYMPRKDAGNGTILEGTFSVSMDKQEWSEPRAFQWERNADIKQILFEGHPKARYVKLSVTKAVGDFGSGQELYVFKVPGTESILQGDINRDKRIDDNDLTSYMNYTGLRKTDSDFDYVSIGDINKNGLIDAYDISVVATELEGGVYPSNQKVEGSLILTPNVDSYDAGAVVEVKVSGKDLKVVNALSFGLPYSTDELEYVGMELLGMKEMVNLTYDRLHSNGQKSLYPTFVNKGYNFLLEDGDQDLFILRFRAKKAGKFNLKGVDGILVDRDLRTVSF